MSTKAIREALSQLNRLMPESTCVGPALDEVEAIKRAAKALVSEDDAAGAARALHLMASIATEAP